MKNRASSAVFLAIIQKVCVLGGDLRRHYSWIGVSTIALLLSLGLHFTHQLKYYPLIHALADRQWVRADIETLDLFETYRFLEQETDRDATTPQNLSAIPCDELKAVDKLWLKYSDGRFGLSVRNCSQQKPGLVENLVSDKHSSANVDIRQRETKQLTLLIAVE